MPENEDKIKKLYDTFVSDGYDMESEEDFRKNLSDSTKRKAAYDALVKDGYEMEPFEEFENNIGFGKIQTPAPEPAVQTEQAWQPTEQEKAEMIASTNRMMQNVETQIQDANERVDNIQEYGLNPGLQTKEGKMQFNPENGKLEKTYITPLGNKTTSKPLADIESFWYRQAADMSIGGQLRKANLRLQELKAKQAERASEVHKEWVEETEKNKAPLAAILGAATYTPRQQSDKENSALRVAIRETEELIKNLEEQKDRENGVDVGFWRGFGRTMGDVRTWDFGMGDMADAMTMMNADKFKGDNATEGERESYDMMMGAIHEKQQAEERYGGNADFWNRAGVMTGYMPSFMLDFILTGGGFNGLSTFSKGSTKVAAKVIGKETAEKMAQQGFKSYIKENGVRGLGQYATDWTIKALGTTADDLLVRAPLMTNTIQAGKTVSDIIDRKLGDVVVDENGNYDFSNDKTWGSAIWQGEANAIIENYSEMFGAHLDPILTLGNMSKLANVLGAKRLGGVLSKADAGALNSIMGQTHQMFNKMGVSDYVGEVSEEYYGQLWRTMLNLDDAYQQNPDGTRTNLFATGQFHGDIWGGMALSMGLMGAGKHTLSAANYASMKHGVNKADAKVNEMLGNEIWEPLRATLDLTTNENVGEVAELIAKDQEFTTEEKAAVLEYMEHSLNLRGFNLGTLAQKRGGEQDENVQAMNESYLDGYNIASPQEMNDAKNMLDYQRQRMIDVVGTNDEALEGDAVDWLNEARNARETGDTERAGTIIDYLNAKQVYDGMIQRVRDDIDGRVEQSNSMIDARVNRKTGMIQGATMKQDERKVYVLSGTLVPYTDGSGVSVTDSDNSIIVRDADTGGLEQVSPDAILSIDDVQDPYEQKELAAQSIREQFAREAADKIDGVVTFNPGETYTIAAEGGSQIQVTIVSDENGIIDNGDGTINVTDGTNVFPVAKEAIQQSVDAFNIARIAEFEQQRTEENLALQQEEREAGRSQYAMNDLVTLRDENGIGIRGNITADVDADGLYEVYTEDALNGKRVNMFTREELDSMLIEHNGQPVEIANSSVNDNSEVAASSLEEQQLQVSALERIPKDEQGNPIYEQAETPDLAWDAIVEQTEGDEAMAQSVANGMVADKEAALKKIEKTKSAGGNTIAEKIVAEKERKAAIDAAKQELSIWQKIAGTANRRKMEADAERRRIADEATALRKAEEEKLRAEREEAERKEREALNGVPDIVEDVPKDARARGYRRVNGHKVDRQEPLQAVQGKEVNVKFSNDVVVPGNVTVIDASLLQPSHIQGVRNSLHFIDEAQPKERNDEASVLSARKIAENIRPEEITSSITAYTGAPTVNERGEVIQGNNRSDALRLMWESHSEQAEAYRQYLKDHAEEFGLRAEDIAPIQSPVLVNMLHVDDTEALNLGQFVAQDTESGGVERIKPKNTLQRMGTEMRSFANLLLRTSDDEMSFAGLVDANGANVLKWMSQRGFISHTQYKSAFDSKGNLTPESKNDLRGIMYQSIFKDGSTRLEEMFNVLPVKAQKAILATAFRDYDSPNSERMVDEIQNSVRAYYALSQDKMFAEAKNFKEARIAVENWKRQYQMDDVTGESYLPADNFSNFVLHLAAMYKGESQSFIQNTFGKIYDLIQGTQEETLFEQPDNTPRTLVQAIKEALNLDYNGQQRSNVLVGDTATSQRGQQGSNGDLAPRERVEDGNGTIDDTGRTESIGEQSEIEPSLSQEEMLSSGDTDNQLSAKIARRIEVQEDDWVESGKYGDTYKQTIIVDGTHKVIKVDAPDTKGNYTGSTYEYDGQTFGDLLDVVNYIDASSSLANAVAVAEKETDTTPTEKQKEAGNYKKGHVQVGTFNITIENPKGSVRSGIDTEGNKWETTMQNTYGYIRGTEGVDGDHIDVFLSDDIDGWNGRKVFVVDQYNEDGTFDEHKVMLGFNEADDAEAAYFANYDRNWAKKHKTMLTGVNLEEFKKWIESSHRKTKAFSEYKSVKTIEGQSSGTQGNRLSEVKSRIEELHKEQEAAHNRSDIFEEARIISEINDLFTEQRKLEQDVSSEEATAPTDAPYTITPVQYITKRGKVLDMQLVEFQSELRKEVQKHVSMFAKEMKGWWDREKHGFMMRSEEDAKRLVEYAVDAQGQPPISMLDIQAVNDGDVLFTKPKAPAKDEKQDYTPVWQYSVSVDKETGYTTLTRDDVSGPIPIGDAGFRQTTNSPEEMIERTNNISPQVLRKQMTERVKELAALLHLDNVEVVTNVSGLKGKTKSARGFYTKSTGKISVVIPNNTNLADVEQTLLHEAVAHYGLRKMFGTHFDTFLDNIFNNADENVRRKIVELATKNGWDFRKATEEYLAGLAEHINFEEARKNGWWQRIKQFFFEMLDKLGFSDFRGVTLTDNELRYILWRSYENLKEGKHSNLFGEAADIAMQHKLRVGEFADTSTDDVLNRDGDPEIHERTLARAKYEQRVKSGMYQSQEALQDSMLGLKEAMTAILGKNTRMEDVDGFENAYLGENRLSSVNKAEADAFAHLLFKPMLEEVAKLAHNTAEREELTDYMMAKHGLERNRVMAERDAQKDFAEYQKQHPKSTKTLQDFIDECRKRDYAGLTALAGMEEIADAEAEAQVMVDEYENAHDTTALWSKVNAVSKAVLSKSYECGMMSKETYDSVRDMYEFYIPLRGFDEKTSSEAYAYLTHKQSLFNAPIKKAEGRRSKADDPFANLQSMAESAIMQGNRNKLVKQKFLNFALNHPSDLVSVSDLWLQYDAVADEWKPIFPDNIDINDSPEEVERKMNEFEDKMKQLAESAPDNYKHGKDAINIPYRVVENRNLRQHQVVVKRNGRDYVITINGNPRAAQALNGQTNPDNDISGSIGQLVHLIGDVNRTLSSLYTTLQPDFIASNFLRDMVYSNSMVWVKESPKYAIQYNMNFAKLPIVRMVMLLDKYCRGTLDMNDEIEKMFYQFMMNGGETGFSRMADIDEHKKEIKKMLKAANEKIPAHVVRECMATWIGEVGRGIEMRARFAAFVTSRNAGRTIDRSIWDAKEISVNFNKKGAGDKFLGAEGQTMLGNVAAGVSGAGRAGYIFWNAALQGTFGNFLKYAMRHPGKIGTVVASWYGLAMLVTALASAGGDDDDDSYYDIPEHTRRQNLIVKGPGNAWIKIPLPIEYRAVYAMGELTGSSLFHNEKLEVSDVLAQMSQLLPVDMMEGTKALWPSSVKPMVEVSNNESWYGSPIWKDTPYNKYMPNWTKAYKSANKDLVNLSETLNEVSGGSKYRKGTIDLNPAAIEYLLKQYTGGFFTVTNQIRNLINVGTGEKDFDWRYVPLANRMLMSGGDERNVGRGLDEKFFSYLDAYRAKASEFSAIKGDLSLPLEKKAELISEIIIDPEYVKMKGMERIYSKLKKAYDTAKEIGDTSKAEELEKRINELKRKFILEMEQDERK